MFMIEQNASRCRIIQILTVLGAKFPLDGEATHIVWKGLLTIACGSWLCGRLKVDVGHVDPEPKAVHPMVAPPLRGMESTL